MKALSLWQPWASLIAIGAKQYETRSWSTPYRGLLAIHAAKRWTLDEARAMKHFLLTFPDLRAALSPDGLLRPPLGAVLCVCKLVDVLPTEEAYRIITHKEWQFGNYSEGRFAWKLELTEVFDPPIRARGAQGLWDWEWVREG